MDENRSKYIEANSSCLIETAILGYHAVIRVAPMRQTYETVCQKRAQFPYERGIT